MQWTDERIEALKKLWTEGHSAIQIADELGGITRNAVIGKVHRLGLSGRAKPPANWRPREARQPRMPRAARPIRGNSALAHVFGMEPLPGEADIDIPVEQRRTLMELTKATCRWPVGDPTSNDFFFCGGAPVVGIPYCACHARVAYQPGCLPRTQRGRQDNQAAHAQ